MKNLKNYGIQEMNANDIKEINGGWLWVPQLIGDAVIYYYETKAAITNVIDGLSDPN